MIQNYIVFLEYLNNKLEGFFNSQKDYIFCQKGCAKCCKNAQFPYSFLELQYLLKGYLQLDKETRDIISQKVDKIKEDKIKSKEDLFRYECPFLINNECSVYNYRGIVCRTFGLMENADNNIIKTPFCCYEGLNYSNVMDNNEISEDKVNKINPKNKPLAFNINHNLLTSEDFERGFNIKFGEKKPLIDWLTNEGIK